MADTAVHSKERERLEELHYRAELVLKHGQGKLRAWEVYLAEFARDRWRMDLERMEAEGL